jgi:hypothetical protein
MSSDPRPVTCDAGSNDQPRLDGAAGYRAPPVLTEGAAPYIYMCVYMCVGNGDIHHFLRRVPMNSSARTTEECPPLPAGSMRRGGRRDAAIRGDQTGKLTPSPRLRCGLHVIARRLVMKPMRVDAYAVLYSANSFPPRIALKNAGKLCRSDDVPPEWRDSPRRHRLKQPGAIALPPG